MPVIHNIISTRNTFLLLLIFLHHPPSVSSASPRIQPQTSLPNLFQIFVGMSKHDNLSVTRISRNIFFIMYHIKIYSCQGKFFIMGQFFRPLLVVITTHDIKRGLRSFLSTKSIMLLIFLCHDYTFEFHFCMSVILLIIS